MHAFICAHACGAIARSVPCGFTEDGFPIGLQLVAKPHDELALLCAAQDFEAGWQGGACAARVPVVDV